MHANVLGSLLRPNGSQLVVAQVELLNVSEAKSAHFDLTNGSKAANLKAHPNVFKSFGELISELHLLGVKAVKAPVSKSCGFSAQVQA